MIARRKAGAQDRQTPSVGLRALDLLVALWCLFVGIIFYGGYLDPLDIGLRTGTAAVGYILMLSVAVVVGGLRYLRRVKRDPSGGAGPTPPDRSKQDPSERSGDTEFDR